ncbi:MAG: ribose transport system substrate-binding protein [Abditibacteriota bacterium]|nr:ribose transport system substrate-binding protein [Abditibacteriota bacterium]
MRSMRKKVVLHRKPALTPVQSTLGRLAMGSLAAGVVMLGGCSSPESTSVTPTTSSQETNAAGDDSNAAPNTASGEKLKIAVIPKGLSHAFWQTVRKGADDAGSQMNAQIIWNGPASEAEIGKQVQIVEDAITQKVDGIVLAPIDRKALVAVIEKASTQKVPLVIFDSDADTTKRLSFVATDNYKGGQLAARRMAEIVGRKGKVGQVPVQPNSQSTGDRENGFEDTLKKEFPQIKVVRSQYGFSDRAKSLAAAEDMLTANPDMVGIFGPNESSAVGALGALRSRNRVGKIKIVGFDSANQLVDALKSGDLDSLVLQDPYKMGFEGVKAIVDSKAGKKVPARIDTGVTLVTKANMDTPENQKLLNVK